MRTRILAGITLTAAASLTFASSAQAANFSLSEPFDTPGPMSSAWVTSGSLDPAVVNNSSQTPANVLQLTNNGYDQSGFAVYDQLIPIDQGLDIHFTQAQWGGDGAADGISFFIKDAADTDTTPGAAGGGLGYAPDVFTSTLGLSGALLGVGLDGYGNFDELRDEGNDCDHGQFVQYPWPDFSSTIVVRGPGQGLDGYCRLADTVKLSDLSLPLLVNGYTNRADATRHVHITIDAATVADPRVKVYYEDTLVIDIAEPAEFASVSGIKMGFASSTGGETDYHEIWGLTVESLVKVDEPTLPNTGIETWGALALGGGLFVAGAVVFAVRRRTAS